MTDETITYPLQWLGDSSALSRERSKQTPESGETSLSPGDHTPSEHGLSTKKKGEREVKRKKNKPQNPNNPLRSEGRDTFRRLVLFDGVGQQVNKNKEQTSRKMDGWMGRRDESNVFTQTLANDANASRRRLSERGGVY